MGKKDLNATPPKMMRSANMTPASTKTIPGGHPICEGFSPVLALG